MKNHHFPFLVIFLFFIGCEPKIPVIQLDAKTNQLFDPCGEKIILRGVNKMLIFDDNDPYGEINFKEIAKTKANCVRIAWGTARPNLVKTTSLELDSVLTKCSRNKLIPIIGLWDHTDENDGGFSKLNLYVDYWTEPTIVKVLKKHQGHIIINVGNECADILNEDDLEDFNLKTTAFVDAYITAIDRIRKVGLICPIMIDGLDRGKSLNCFSFKRNNQTKMVADELLESDVNRNLIFSAHTYWPRNDGATEDFITQIFQKAINSKIPFVVGELTKYGAGGNPATMCSTEGEINYQKIAQICQANEIGWMAWEWGPGNKFGGDGCEIMDMTIDSKFSTLKGWGLDLVQNTEYGLLAKSKVNRWSSFDFIACPNKPEIPKTK